MIYSYHQLSLHEFERLFSEAINPVNQFELTLPWLKATAQFMLPAGASVIVHCLMATETSSQAEELIVAIPFIHLEQGKRLKSLGSFYSTVIEHYYAKHYDESNHIKALECLVNNILQLSSWQTLQIGPIDQNSELADLFANGASANWVSKVFSKQHNIYQDQLSTFEQYYAQLPSQLKNTLSRRGKKLAKSTSYNIDIVSSDDLFDRAFNAYKAVYTESWKGDEYSYDFIEQVCRSALAKNQLRLGILYVNDKPAAAQIWFVQSTKEMTTASIFKLAYHPDFQQFSVGSILSLAISEYVLSHDKVDMIEFGMGDESYKQDWLKMTKSRLTLQVFNRQNILGRVKAMVYVWLPKLKRLKRWLKK